MPEHSEDPTPAGKMHVGEADIDSALVANLLSEQFPQWADLPVRPVQSTGTVNAIYRIGDDLCARLPRMRSCESDLDREWHLLPRLAPHLTLSVPEPVAKGAPSEEYPYLWSVYRWISGELYSDGLIDDEARAAEDLALFVRELRKIEVVADAPSGGRQPLHDLDAETRRAIESSRDFIDSGSAMAAWELSLDAPVWDGQDPVWIHADLLRPNLLVREGRIHTVLDFGACGVGDPAADVIPAWAVFDRAGRETFREALDVDDGTWGRARGFALHQAAMIIPYYRETNPDFATMAIRTVGEVLSNIENETRL